MGHCTRCLCRVGRGRSIGLNENQLTAAPLRNQKLGRANASRPGAICNQHFRSNWIPYRCSHGIRADNAAHVIDLLPALIGFPQKDVSERRLEIQETVKAWKPGDAWNSAEDRISGQIAPTLLLVRKLLK